MDKYEKETGNKVISDTSFKKFNRWKSKNNNCIHLKCPDAKYCDKYGCKNYFK